MSSHDRDDFAPETQIKRAGTITITDTETGETTVNATFAAEDILDALRRGESIESIIARCEDVEVSHKANPQPKTLDNPFPVGM